MKKSVKTSNERFQVVIIGAGPAGASAAILLAQSGHRVALIDRATYPRKVVCAGWLNARATPLLTQMGVPTQPLLEQAFHEVTFHSADFEKHTMPSFQEAPGYLIDRTQFDNTLVETAQKNGVTFLQGSGVVGVTLRESSVVLLLDNETEIEADLLMIAAGRRGSTLLEQVGITRARGVKPIWCAQIDAELTDSAAAPKPGVDVVLGLDRRGSFAMICRRKSRISVNVQSMSDPEGAVSQLIHLCRLGFERKIIPTDLSEASRSVKTVPSPASVALEMDSHVGKHTLAIGDAGGFVSAASNEGIYPAMWSARIAVDVAKAALSSPLSQDELMTFNSEWRIQMADYLRSPHTDIQFLLPLIFSNQPMADRMGAAFFSGENI